MHRPRRGVMERRPGHVAGGAVGIHASQADAGLHVGFDLGHHPGNGPVACRVQSHRVILAGEGPQDAGRLVQRHREIVADPPVRVGAGGQPLAGHRVQVIDHPPERLLGHPARQAELLGELAAPFADRLLSLGVVIGDRVVILSVRR